jgi:hypothetical protein
MRNITMKPILLSLVTAAALAFPAAEAFANPPAGIHHVAVRHQVAHPRWGFPRAHRTVIRERVWTAPRWHGPGRYAHQGFRFHFHVRR